MTEVLDAGYGNLFLADEFCVQRLWQLKVSQMRSFSDLYNQLYPKSKYPNKPPLGLQSINQALQDEQLVLLVVYPHGDPNHLVGYLLMAYRPSLEGRVAWIDDMVIEANYRKQGLGSLLLSQAQNQAIQADSKRIFLLSSLWRTESHSLYAGFGFKTMSRYYFAKEL